VTDDLGRDRKLGDEEAVSRRAASVSQLSLQPLQRRQRAAKVMKDTDLVEWSERAMEKGFEVERAGIWGERDLAGGALRLICGSAVAEVPRRNHERGDEELVSR
jgi:hypothetical protein